MVAMGSPRRWLRVRRGSAERAITDLGSSNRKARADAAIRIWARRGKGFTSDEKSRCIQALTPLAVDDPDPAARAQAIAALASLDAPGAVDLVLAALEDPDWGARMIVASELVPMDDSRVLDALVRLLEDEDGFVRDAAAIGLEQQGDPRALAPLRAMLEKERDSGARRSARHAIRRLERR
jgi:HEAT repeat protein